MFHPLREQGLANNRNNVASKREKIYGVDNTNSKKISTMLISGLQKQI